jgi:tryptophan-rich sensory protein
MATITAASFSPDTKSVLDANRRDILGLLLSAALPLAAYVVFHGFAQLNHVMPLFFAPFGLPGWAGCALYLAALPIYGIARWMVAEKSADGASAGWWLVALMAGTIVFPFIVAPLDSLALAIISMGLLMVGLGAGIRTARVSRLAGLVMLPGLAWMGLSAFVGLSFVAGWTPPFGLTNANANANVSPAA